MNKYLLILIFFLTYTVDEHFIIALAIFALLFAAQEMLVKLLKDGLDNYIEFSYKKTLDSFLSFKESYLSFISEHNRGDILKVALLELDFLYHPPQINSPSLDNLRNQLCELLTLEIHFIKMAFIEVV